MKILIFSLLFASSFVFAENTVLTCEVKDGTSKGRIFLDVENIDSDLPQLSTQAGYLDYEGEPVSYSYSDDLEWLWLLLTSQDGHFMDTDRNGNMLFHILSDGCDNGKVHLYKNSNFQFGYLVIYHSCSGPDKTKTFAKVECQR